MKKQLLLLAALALTSASSFGQAVGTLPFYEPFDYYPTATRLIEESATVTTLKKGGSAYWWLASAGSTLSSSTPVIADQPYTTSFTNYPSTVGNCLAIGGGSDDPLFTFTEQTATDNIDLFSSFLYRVVTPTTDNFTSTTGNYFYAFTKTSSSGTPSNYTSCVYIRYASPGKFNLGISETNSTGVIVWGTTAYSYDTDYLIVIRYQYDTVTNTTGLSSLWVNPAVSNVMPAATLTTASDTATSPRIIGASPSSGLKYIKINKDSNATNPNGFIDEIRVANTWWQALGQASAPLAVAQNEISGLNVYPNPVSNGVVYINSSSSDSKSVVVYDVLGKQLLQQVVTNGTLNVSTLNKGVYIMKVTEGAATSTKKLVIE